MIDKSKDEQLIHDKATINYMIQNSPLGAKSTGIPRFQTTSHKIVLQIIDNDDIPELLLLNKLTNEEGDWPIVCYRAQNNPALSSLGVIRGIPPEVKENRIKANLIREGAHILSVTRIKNYRGDTYTVKIQFVGTTIPETVKYNGNDKTVFPYLPPANRLLCLRCGKGRHKIVNCKTRNLKCPICSQPHERRECPKTDKKCPNCEGPHTANYHLCPYLIREQDLVKMRIIDNIPRHRAINIWEERARQRSLTQNNPNS